MKSVDDTSAPADSAGRPARPDLYDADERKALVAEIVREVKKDSIKQAVLAEMKQGRWSLPISKFFQHPAVLLVISFAITGYIGTKLTQSWQREEWDRQKEKESQEWERQQLRLIDIRGFELKNQIIDELTKSVGERNSAAAAVVGPLLSGVDDKQLMRDEEEPIKEWRRVRNEWRVKSIILRLKIQTHIKSPEAAETFARILKEETSIGVMVDKLQLDPVKFNRVDSDERVLAQLDDTLNSIRKTGEELKQLVTIISEEARSDVKSSTPPHGRP